jgi:hypothetical protein
MGMPETARQWTADMVRALPDDGNRCEVIDGELFVTPDPARAPLEIDLPAFFKEVLDD